MTATMMLMIHIGCLVGAASTRMLFRDDPSPPPAVTAILAGFLITGTATVVYVLTGADGSAQDHSVLTSASILWALALVTAWTLHRYGTRRARND